MKKKHAKQYAGVWMDNSEAFIISDSGEKSEDFKISGKVSSAAHMGGGSEHAMNNAKTNDTLKFFKSISKQLLDFDEIFVFGPGKAQEQFRNHLKDDFQFNNKPISIDSADQLTDPQLIARVREFFKNKS